ncbi:hypothetical protein L1049_011065 [Liquidambar formosana]|uniref:Histidine-containing phosphotransfer protein n=1 Tax=Liquidambar formosana TaxID=63359 RepID=A0AAP0RUR7_LIQFO
MATTDALNHQLQDLIRAMENEGLLDKNFGIVHSLKEANSPFFLVELIPMFCTDVQTDIRKLTQTLDQPSVDYHDLEEYCIKIKGGSSCIGARRMALACVDLRRAIDNKSKEGCFLALNGIKHEFYNLRGKLDTILQLERRIISHDNI